MVKYYYTGILVLTYTYLFLKFHCTEGCDDGNRKMPDKHLAGAPGSGVRVPLPKYLEIMIELSKQSELRQARAQDFCYICGKPLAGEPVDIDHVPPTCLFKKEDRDTPLILRTHRRCNNAENLTDEKMGQLVNLIHGKPPKPDRLKPKIYTTTDNRIMAGTKINLKGVIWRWVKGFHTALYKEFLPPDSKVAIHPSLPVARKTAEGYMPDEKLEQHRIMAEVLSQSRRIGRIDRIICRNSKCIYECTWDTDDNGFYMCIFGLRIYNWEKLGDQIGFAKRGCVGFYRPKSGIPAGAATASNLKIPIRLSNPLDPFSPTYS